jgi:hypothetical protein
MNRLYDLLSSVASGPPLYAAGLGSGLANRVAHHFGEYKPAAFSADDIDRGVVHVREIVKRWEDALKDVAPGESFVGKRVLELGPGHSLGTGLVLLARGASAYTAVDVFPLAYRSPAALYATIAAAEGCTPDLIRQANFQIVNFPDLKPLDGTFDVVVSNSTLEHVDDVPATFRTLRQRCTGIMIHHVDARVHLRIRSIDPLNHLRFDRRTYQLMYFKGVPNRLLSEDYERAAHDAGFGETRIIPSGVASSDYLARVRPRLAPHFRDRRDLQFLSFTVVAR